MKEKLELYIKENLEIEIKPFFSSLFKQRKSSTIYDEYRSLESNDLEEYASYSKSNIKEYIEENNTYNDFQTLLFKYIDEKELKDSDVYNKVHIDRRLFSKIRSNKDYHPSKETIILLGISLELNEEEIEKLLESASYSLPKNNHFDLIIRFCFINKIYRISDINELLNDYNCKLFNYEQK